MNKSLKTILILAVLAATTYLLVTKVFMGEEEKKQGGPPAGPMAQRVAVDVYVVSAGAYQNKITSTGTVLPNEEVELRSEIPGRVTNIRFEEGARVKQGQLLLSVNADDLRAQLQKLQSNQKLYRDMEARQRTLLEKEYISKQEYEQVSNQLAMVNADIRALQATLAKANIRAPFSGVVGLRQVSEGTIVSTTTPIAQIVDVSPVKIEFSIPGRYSQLVKNGDVITFTSEGSPEAYKAKVYAVQPNIDPTTRTLSIRALYDNKNEEIKPGSFVQVSLTLKESDETILIPTEAIIPEATGHKVFLAKGGKAAPKMVKIGQRSETMIQILEGIEPGDTIISSGILQARPGSVLNIRKVRHTNEVAAAPDQAAPQPAAAQ